MGASRNRGYIDGFLMQKLPDAADILMDFLTYMSMTGGALTDLIKVQYPSTEVKHGIKSDGTLLGWQSSD